MLSLSMDILSNIRSIGCLSRFNDDKHLLLDKRLRIRARIKGYCHYQKIFKRLRFDDEKIFVKTVGPFHSVRESLPQKNVEVIQTKKDVGVVFNEFSEDDREELFSYFE